MTAILPPPARLPENRDTERLLGASYEQCRSIAKREARNFYFSFLTLSLQKRNAMCAIYSWMRRLDDLADDAPSPEVARTLLESWKSKTHKEFQNHNPTAEPGENIWPALSDTVRQFDIPPAYFDEIIEGTLMDQSITRYKTFDELYPYCYRVASVVGLVCLRVFQFKDPQAEKCGEWLGIAFQLTNILRDVREDAERGRIYLPCDELAKHGITEQDILDQKESPKTQAYFREFADRIEQYYEKARPITRLVSKESKPTLQIMTEIYHGILDKIRSIDYLVLTHRARVPTWKKMAIVARYQLGFGG